MTSKKRKKKNKINKEYHVDDDEEEKQKNIFFSSLSLEVLNLNFLHASLIVVPCNGETNEENVCLWITKRPQSIIILLTCGICVKHFREQKICLFAF